MQESARGVTLIELMIVVTIVSILLVIAAPTYNERVANSRRADAQTALIGLAAALERYYVEQQPSTYAGSAQADGSPITTLYPSQAPLDGAAKFYDLTITGPDATSYTVSAVPITGSAQDGDRCGTFTLDSTGVRNAAEANCWR